MNVSDKCEILEEFMRGDAYFDAHALAEFITHNDFGIPIAQAVSYGLVFLTDEGESLMEETWQEFCVLLGIPADGDYDDYDDCLRARG